jgi:hypothetical protein
MAIMKPTFPRLQRGHPLARGLVGAWQFYEGAGLSLHDVSGNGNHGALINHPTWVPGRAGYALSFDGTNQGVQLASPLSSSGPLTIGAWINPVDLQAGTYGGRIIDNRGSLGQNGWTIFTRSNAGQNLEFFHDGGPSLVVIPSVTIPLNSWTHVALTWDGGTNATGVHIYANGKETTYVTQTNGVSLRTGSDYTYFGRDYSASAPFKGAIDDGRIYNRVLSAAEVMQMYVEGG